MGPQIRMDAHEQQSSRMSFGEGWKHGKVEVPRV